MINIKRIVELIIAAVAFMALPLCSYGASISIDGNPRASEWDGAVVVNVIDNGEGSNCGVEYARLKAVIDNEEGAVYFLFMSMCDGLEQGNGLCGVSVDVNSSGAVVVCPGSNPLSYDTDKYNFTAASYIGDNESYYCEMRVGFKYGVPQKIPVAVRFIDAQGEPSTVYKHILINAEFSEPVATTVVLPETQSATKAATTKPVKTTKAVTTKEQTTRERRTVATTAQRTKKSATSEKTTIPVVIVNVVMPTTKVRSTTQPVSKVSEPRETTQVLTYTAPEIPSQTQYVLYTENTAQLKRKRLTISFACVAALGGISVLVMLSGRRSKSVADSLKGDAGEEQS